MTECFTIHPTHPQQRLIKRVTEIVQRGGVIVYPTDSGYALGCGLGQKEAAERIFRIRQLDKQHNFTLMCRDLSELSLYARVDNPTFRILKAHTPGAYTFILMATKEVPRRLQNVKRKTIGLRVPDHAITQAILSELHQPLMSVTLIFPDEEMPICDINEIRVRLNRLVDAIVDGGSCSMEPTSIIDLTTTPAAIIRTGKADVSDFI